MDHDLGQLYESARVRITGMLDGADDSLNVAATPEWTVHDVIAHLSGVVEDALSGNLDGVTTDPWTAAQVERGRGTSTVQLLRRRSIVTNSTGHRLVADRPRRSRLSTGAVPTRDHISLTSLCSAHARRHCRTRIQWLDLCTQLSP